MENRIKLSRAERRKIVRHIRKVMNLPSNRKLSHFMLTPTTMVIKNEEKGGKL